MPDNASNRAADYSVTHGFKILRVAAGMRVKAFGTLLALEKELTTIIEAAGDKPTLNSAKYKEMLLDAQVTIADTYKLIAKNHGASLSELAGIEWNATNAMINKAVGVDIVSSKIPPKILEAVVQAPVVLGHSSADWWNGQSADLRQKFQAEMAKGTLLGETTPELIKRMRGAGVFEKPVPGAPQGIMKKAKRDAEALVLSSSASIANHARLESFKAKSDLIKGVQWLSTLDSRTTPICMALDGKQWRLPDFEPVGHDKAFPGPTAHWRCRSTQISVLRSWEELSGKKLPSIDNATLQERVDQILEASGMSEEKRNAARVRTRASMDGQVASNNTYDSWAKSKGSAFIEQVLGPGRAALYNAGEMTFSDLTDQNNRPITLKELAASVANGINPPETLGVDFLPLKAALASFSDPRAESKAAIKAEALAKQAELDAIEKATNLAAMKDVFVNSTGQFSDGQLAMWKRLPQEEKDVYLADWNEQKAAKKAAAKAAVEAKIAAEKAAEEAIIAAKAAEEAAKQAAALAAKQQAEALAAKLEAEKQAAEEAAAKAKAEAEAKKKADEEAAQQAEMEKKLLNYIEAQKGNGGAFDYAHKAALLAKGKGASQVLKEYNLALDASAYDHLTAYEAGLDPADVNAAPNPIIKKAYAQVTKSVSNKGASQLSTYQAVEQKIASLKLEAANKKIEKSIIKKLSNSILGKGKPITSAENDSIEAYLADLTPAEKISLEGAVQAEVAKQKAAKAAKILKVAATIPPPAGAQAVPPPSPSLAGKANVPSITRGKPLPAFPNEDVPDPSLLSKVKNLGGTTGAELHKDKDGNLYVVKKGAEPDHVREEAAADELYRRLGVRVPAGRIFETAKGPIKVTKFASDAVALSEALADPKRAAAVKKAIQEDFAVDILLGNWDVAGAGMDNILVTPTNQIIRIDNGGSLRFRAMGTPKVGNEWDDTPTELFTMRRLPNPDGTPLKPDGANHAKLFADADLISIAKRIEKMDRAGIETMEIEEGLKITLLKRFDELQVVARRTLDQAHDSWKPAYAEAQSTLAFTLKYNGLREAIPQQLKVTGSKYSHSITDENGKPFGRLRSSSNSNATAPKLNGTPLPADKFFPDIETALKNLNYHANNSSPPSSLNAAKQASALAHEPALMKLLAGGTADEKKMAATYLGAIGTIKAAKTVTTLKASPKVDQFLLKPKAGAAPMPSKNTSITAELWNLFEAKHGAKGREAMQIVARWQSSQAGNSWNDGALVAKYWMAQRRESGQGEYYWNGNSQKRSFATVKAQYDAAAKQVGEDVLEDAFLHWHTMTQELLAWADIPYNDRARGVVRLVRTESDEVLQASKIKKGTDIGKTVKIQRSSAESHSVFWETYVYGSSGNAFWSAVPHHRVLGTYLTERRPGDASGAFLGDSENEFVTDTNGMPSIYSPDDPAKKSQSTSLDDWGVPTEHLR